MKDTEGANIAAWLTMFFVIAKLTGLIAWSWWWVFSPIWISAALCIAVLIIIALIAFIVP